ncbi:MAG: EF-P beta-lysylation protein EpmB [Pseudomonadota bacterium]|nr:MAG: EF-P beta-lysylation protein EpmB [Pseudomonadota bacterium]
MIPEIVAIRQTPKWQHELAAAITDPQELLAAVGLGAEWLPAARAAARTFPLRVPRGFIARMRRGDAQDPLLRQVLPLGEECQSAAGFVADPVGDMAAMKLPGLLHKYRGRVLLTVTGACAIHCRYCFRRHFPYGDANAAADHGAVAVQYIAADPSIREVILSGGDPLSLSDRKLTELVRALDVIPHLDRLRVHTRLPIVLPERITDDLVALLTGIALTPVVVVHANHANEIDAAVRGAVARLRDAGISVLNQSVLLRGVNDDVDALAQLSETLFAAGALPYYLHLLDPVHGAAHFDVEEARARALIAQLAARLPGYLVPRLVRELAGSASKQVLSPRN